MINPSRPLLPLPFSKFRQNLSLHFPRFLYKQPGNIFRSSCEISFTDLWYEKYPKYEWKRPLEPSFGTSLKRIDLWFAEHKPSSSKLNKDRRRGREFWKHGGSTVFIDFWCSSIDNSPNYPGMNSRSFFVQSLDNHRPFDDCSFANYSFETYLTFICYLFICYLFIWYFAIRYLFVYFSFVNY